MTSYKSVSKDKFQPASTSDNRDRTSSDTSMSGELYTGRGTGTGDDPGVGLSGSFSYGDISGKKPPAHTAGIQRMSMTLSSKDSGSDSTFGNRTSATSASASC